MCGKDFRKNKSVSDKQSVVGSALSCSTELLQIGMVGQSPTFLFNQYFRKTHWFWDKPAVVGCCRFLQKSTCGRLRESGTPCRATALWCGFSFFFRCLHVCRRCVYAISVRILCVEKKLNQSNFSGFFFQLQAMSVGWCSANCGGSPASVCRAGHTCTKGTPCRRYSDPSSIQICFCLELIPLQWLPIQTKCLLEYIWLSPSGRS